MANTVKFRCVLCIVCLWASARSSIIENTASALTAQSAFLNNFETVVNRRVNIQEDIKRYQDTLGYASSKVDYSVGQNIYMLLSNMKLKIKTGTVGYDNKILISDGKFILGKNKKVNLMIPVIKSHKTNSLAQKPNISQKNQEPKTITHNDEKIALVLSIAGGFAIWNIFR